MKNQEKISEGLGYAHGFFRTFDISSLALYINTIRFRNSTLLATATECCSKVDIIINRK